MSNFNTNWWIARSWMARNGTGCAWNCANQSDYQVSREYSKNGWGYMMRIGQRGRGRVTAGTGSDLFLSGHFNSVQLSFVEMCSVVFSSCSPSRRTSWRCRCLCKWTCTAGGRPLAAGSAGRSSTGARPARRRSRTPTQPLKPLKYSLQLLLLIVLFCFPLY